MKIKLNYIIIPLLTFLVAQLGSYYSQQGQHWYNTLLAKPYWTPPNWVFGLVWQVIYACTALAVIWVYNSSIDVQTKLFLLALFIVNACLNISWTYFFFYKKMIYASLCCNIALYVTILALLIILRKYIPQAALLLVPYVSWITFALYLNYAFWNLNKHLWP